jgi:quinohemoprotein ethanol dehydrogenase
MTLADLVIDGQPRKVLMQAPKNGFFYVIDRLTGKLLSAEKITDQINWATHVDLTTGRPVETKVARYDTTGVWISPGTMGAHNWHPMAFSPRTGLVYIPGQNSQNFHRLDANYVPELGRLSTGTNRGPVSVPVPPLHPAGFLIARDPVTQRDRWRIDLPTARNGGVLVTASDVLFSGRREGALVAHDARTGQVLWQSAVAPAPAAPITYELDGRQYVTVCTGAPPDAKGLAGRVYTFVLDR